MAERKKIWKYVYGCEHCGEFEIPKWGIFDGGTDWCSDCVTAYGDNTKIPKPPKKIEEQMGIVTYELAKLNLLVKGDSKKRGEEA